MKLKFKAYLFLQYFALGIWGPYLPVFLNDKHFSGLQMGLLLGTMPIVMVIFQPVWGYLSDVLGTRRNLLVISSVSSGMAVVALGSAERFEFAFLWAMLFSALWTPIIPISTAILLESLEESGQEEKFSLVRLWGSVGFGVSSLLMGSLFLDQIVNTLGWFTGVTCFILAGASLLMPEKGDGLPLPEVKGGQVLTKNPQLVIYLIASTFIGATLGIYNNYQTLFMQYLNAQSWLVGLTVSLQALVEVPFMLLVPYALKRFGMQTAILAGALVLPLRWLLYVFIQRPGWVAPSQVLHGVAIVSFFVVGVTYIDQLISPSWRATGQALYGTALYGVGSAIGVYLAGLFIEWFDLRSIWVLNIVLGLIGLGLLLIAFKQKPPAEDQPIREDDALPQGAGD
jgi:PPP family 3-phenylpropionic acid transporter